MKKEKLETTNKKNIAGTVTNDYLSFILVYKRKRIALLNFDAEDCTLYDNKEKAFLNPYLKGFSDKKLHLQIVKDAGNWQIVSNREVFVNGVAWRKRVLRDGDKIFLGEYRLIFESNFIEDTSPEPITVKDPIWRRRLRFFEAAAVILSVTFFWYCSTINYNGKSNLISDNPSSIGHESDSPYNYSEDLNSIGDISELPEAAADDVTLIVYSPEDIPVQKKLDILFIHAHPDDESLDYGLYMAQASESGKSVGIVVFTDGDSGFDKYPDRPVDGFYKDSYLNGSELAEVRVKEAEKALTVLGVEVYVRLGLWNRSYTSTEVSKSITTLLNEWGGRDQLVSQLVGIMEIFQPDIIVSPDGPCGAMEHFEHEAVGFISELAVNSYKKKNKLKAYLKLVDVQQTAVYEGIPLLSIDTRGDNRRKEQKYSALMMHQTQADASYYGIKRLEAFPVEYYMVQYSSETMILH